MSTQTIKKDGTREELDEILKHGNLVEVTLVEYPRKKANFKTIFEIAQMDEAFKKKWDRDKGQLVNRMKHDRRFEKKTLPIRSVYLIPIRDGNAINKLRACANLFQIRVVQSP